MTATEPIGVGSGPLVVLLSVDEPTVVTAAEHIWVGSWPSAVLLSAAEPIAVKVAATEPIAG